MDTKLLTVVTLSEAAELWRKHRLTILRAIDSRMDNRQRKPPLVARKSPDNEQGIWLISVESLRARWGDPVKPPSF